MASESEIRRSHESQEAIVAVEEVVIREGDITEVLIVEEIIDLEVYAKQGKKAPHAKGYPAPSPKALSLLLCLF